MPESKRSRRLKKRWDQAREVWTMSQFLCWDRYYDENHIHHTCKVTDAGHTGPHLCCCGYEWELADAAKR